MENKKIKYFTKFDDSIHKERILAKLMKLNYKILIAKMINSSDDVEKFENERENVYQKAIQKSEQYLKFCVYEMKKCLKENAMLRHFISEENVKRIKENRLIFKFYKQQYNFYKKDFVRLLDASVSCVKNGEVVPFENLSDEIKKNLTFENAFDVIINLRSIIILGYTLADINYRCKILRHNMPIFMTKEEFKLFSKASNRVNGEILRNPNFTDMAIISNIYDKENVINKQIYENVFPEFGFKYEDRENENMDVYSINFSNIYE